MCASFRVGIYLFDLWAKRLIFWKFCLAPTSYCEKEDDDDKNLSLEEIYLACKKETYIDVKELFNILS